MPRQHRHTIMRQVFELQCADAQRGQALLRLVEAENEAQVLPALEKVFDQFAVGGLDMEIERLEIDLGDVSVENFERELPRLVAAAMQRALQDLLQSPEGAQVRQRSQEQSEWEALGAFLRHGRGEWWIVEQEFSPSDLLLKLAQADPGRLRSWLMQFGTDDKSVWLRLAGMADARIFQALLNAFLGADDGAELLTIWALVLQVAKAIGVDAVGIWELRAALLRALAQAPALSEALFGQWRQQMAWPALWSALVGRASREDGWGETASQRTGRGWLLGNADALGVTNAGLRDGGNSMASTKAAKTEATPEGEEVLVPNAGLAIVAGFLPTYFGHLGLLEGERFVDVGAQLRAVQLLEVLARGLHPVEEHALLLNKLICRLPLEAPLDLGNPPTESDLMAADELLMAVIGHWTVLGEISPDQLRGGFLLREGWLKRGSQGWTLRVDRRSYDVVLEKLPWSIGVIALPWMDGKVWVEW